MAMSAARMIVMGFLLASVHARSARRTQATEASQWDAAISALCTSATVATSPTITQSDSHEVTVTVGSADAVWLTNEYGDVLTFSSAGGTSRTLTFGEHGSEPHELVAHAHYADCSHGMSERLTTWYGAVQAYESSDASQGFGEVSRAWTEAEVAAATPQFTTVNYGNKLATISVAVPAGKTVAFQYVATGEGIILEYEGGGDSGLAGTRSMTATIPDGATSLNACAPLGSSMTCASVSLVPDIISELEVLPTSAAALSLPHRWPSKASFVVEPPSDALCGTPPVDYSLYVPPSAASASGVAVALGRSMRLNLAPDATVCDYTAGAACTLDVTVVCQGQRRTQTLDLTVTYASHGVPTIAVGDVDFNPNRCEEQHEGLGTTWQNSAGQRCECFSGVAECGSAVDTDIHLTQMEAGFVTASAFILFCVLSLICLRIYFQRKDSRQLPIEGKRRSILFANQTDYVTTASGRGSKTRGLGQGEVELPAPQSAGAGTVSCASGGSDEAMVPRPPPGAPPPDVEQRA